MLARRLGDHTHGTATSGSTTTLVDAAQRKEKDNYWLGADCKVYSGTGSGQSRMLSASTQSSGTLTHAASNWTAPDSTSLYELHRLFPAAQYDQFLLESQRWHTRQARLLAWTVDSSLTWTTDQFDYTVPATLVGIQSVEFSTETGAPDTDEYDFIGGERWEIRRSSTRKIVFGTQFGQPVSGTVIRLTGVSEFSDATADSDTFNLDANAIVELAVVFATQSLMGMAPNAKWKELHQAAVAEHDRMLSRMKEPPPSNIKWLETT